MSAGVAELLLSAVAAYAAAGGCVAIGFLVFALDRVDPAARGAYAFRPLLLPGLLLLWPYVLRRWLRLGRARD